MPSKPATEQEMYPLVCRWLKSFLSARHKRSRIRTFDTSVISLYKWVEQNRFEKYFPQYLAYDIRVDVTGIVCGKKKAHLAFVECKLRPITLRDISQLIGYCRVARPKFAWILSPSGITSRVSYLLKTYRRYDVLEYGDQGRVQIATWNHDRAGIDASSILPPG